jgi:mono/diheme cytochrome c family protein
MIATRAWIIVIGTSILMLVLSACDSPNPQPPGLTPIPTLAPGATPTLIAALQFATDAAPTAAPGATTTGAPAGGQATPDAALGASTFLQNCTPCHRVNGEGGTNATGDDVPALRNDLFVQNSDPKAFAMIANGRTGTGMPAWLKANGGPLNEQRISDVLAYLQTLQNVTPIPLGASLPTATPAPQSVPVKPSEAGNVGPAASVAGDATRGRALFGAYCSTCHGPQGVLGQPNPGSKSGFVPVLNPINPTIANADAKVFAANVDVFIEHGSVPAGTNPHMRMPSFGDSKMLAPAQIADVIAYVMSLNKR